MSVIINEDVRYALDTGHPVVALETAVLTAGLPRSNWKECYGKSPEAIDANAPINTSIAMEITKIIRANNAVPAWIGILNGSLVIGLSIDEVLQLANDEDATKASIANCASIMQSGGSAGTTVSATLAACRLSSNSNPIRTFATGGIGGIHQNWSSTLDISADLTALATTPTCVVASGAKSILDLVATVESLETIGVPILGIGHNTFPRFVERGSEQDPTIKQVDDIAEISAICNEHWRKLGFKSSVLATTQVPNAVAIDRGSLQKSIAQAEQDWAEAKLPPPTRTPFLLAQLAKITGGKSLIANFELLCNNALVASKIAVSLKVTTQ